MSEVSIVFTGDIAFTKYFGSPKSAEFLLDNSVQSFLKSADHCAGNVEGPVFRVSKTEQREFAHHSDSAYAALLKEMGIDIWNLANNHALDYGKDGVQETFQHAESVGCKTIGMASNDYLGNKPIVFPEAGGVGIFSVTYSESNMINNSDCSYYDWNSFDQIKSTIENIKLKCKWCVLIVHGGEEFSDMPTPETRKSYLKYLDLGADIVVGHHPHTIQNYEIRTNKIIFYSLGNFIFDTDYQRTQVHTDTGELLKIHFTEESYDWVNCSVFINRAEKRIQKYTDPIIFTNIGEEKYKALWPYAAVGLSKAERRARLFLQPSKYIKFNRAKWFLRDLKGLLNEKKRSMIIAKSISYIKKKPKKEKDMEMIRYLSHV